MRFGSVCSGIEAASVAWHPLGWQTAYVADIEPFPCAVLADRFGAGRPKYRPDHIEPETWVRTLKGIRWGAAIPNYGDFTRIAEESELPGIRVLVGGTPCQAFSFAGHRLSLADARGNLTLQFVRLVHAHANHPNEPLEWAVWENVPGVLSTEDNAFGCFLGGLVGANDPIHVPGGGRWPDSGMVSGPLGRAAWRVFDAQHFGLAQRRHRVFVVFCPTASGGDPAAVLFERKGMPWDFAQGSEAREGVAGTIAGGARQRGGYSCDDVPLAATLLGNDGGVSGKDGTGRGTPLVACPRPIPFDTTQITSKGNRSRAEEGMPAGTLAKTSHAPCIAFQANHSGDGHIAERTDIAPTMRHGKGGGSTVPAIAHAFDGRQSDVCQYGDKAGTLDTDRSTVAVQPEPSSGVRRLTPTECERLQGFPDGHTAILWKGKPAADGPRYKALGNSMAVTVMRWIGERIAAYETGTLDTWTPAFLHGEAA